MFHSTKAYVFLSFLLIYSLWAMAAPAGSGGPAPQGREYPAVTFYVT